MHFFINVSIEWRERHQLEFYVVIPSTSKWWTDN